MMNDPYEVLGLSVGCSGEELRQRYLQLVRQFPPERSPDRFAEIRAAYEELKDPVGRMQQRLFVTKPGCMAEVIVDAKDRVQRERIDVDILLSLCED